MQPPQWQQPPQWPQGSYPPKHEGYKTLAIVFFVAELFTHLLGIIPVLGILFTLIAACLDVCTFIFLCLI